MNDAQSLIEISQPAGLRPDAIMDRDGEGERNEVFGALVRDDSDIVGLVAYSIYKQNKHDWLIAFNKAKGREPTEGELSAYIIGENTPRRLATYRHLAEATLDGRGPTMQAGTGQAGTGSGEDTKPRNYSIAARAAAAAPAAPAASMGIMGLVGLVLVAVIAMILGARYGMPGITK